MRCRALAATFALATTGLAQPAPAPLQVGFLLLDGVYNSELMAPWDVFHHTASHVKPGLRVFSVGRTRAVVQSYEGLRITPDHDLATAPAIDVLVVPSGEHSMGRDVEDKALIQWVAERGAAARHVMSVCDGAFVLAAAGLLDGHRCTTYPGDIPELRKRYPHLHVEEQVRFVAHGKVITGPGGAASYDPAMYLVETLYGKRVAEGIARGLVLEWRLEAVPHLIVQDPVARAARPACYLPGEKVSPDVTIEDASGASRRLADLVAAAEDTRAVVLVLLGGAAGRPNPALAGMWCEDSFNDLALLRRLVVDYRTRGVLFVPVMCPPVYHEDRFGFTKGTFLSGAAPRYADERARFVDATLRLADSGLLPFRKLWFDPRFRLLANPKLGQPAGPRPAWQGRLKWYGDPQSYGTPALWVLRPDLTVVGAPFVRNNYEAEGGRLRYTERDVSARLDRLLGK